MRTLNMPLKNTLQPLVVAIDSSLEGVSIGGKLIPHMTSYGPPILPSMLPTNKQHLATKPPIM